MVQTDSVNDIFIWKRRVLGRMCADAAQEAENVMGSRDAGVREVRGERKRDGKPGFTKS